MRERCAGYWIIEYLKNRKKLKDKEVGYISKIIEFYTKIKYTDAWWNFDSYPNAIPWVKIVINTTLTRTQSYRASGIHTYCVECTSRVSYNPRATCKPHASFNISAFSIHALQAFTRTALLSLLPIPKKLK